MMIIMKRFLYLALFGILLMSCSGDDEDEKKLDDFLGTYTVTKYTGVNVDTTAQLGIAMDMEVIIDPDNSNNLLINNLSIPADDDGSYGPDQLSPQMHIELYFENDEIYFRMSPILINGIALPCTFIGPKK